MNSNNIARHLINIEMSLAIIREELAKNPVTPTGQTTNDAVDNQLTDLLHSTADVFAIETNDLLNKRRYQHLVSARTAFTVRARELGYSWRAIGNALGGLDHSSVIYLHNKAIERIAQFPEHRNQMTQIITGA